MATTACQQQWSDLHMIVLGRIAYRVRADAEDIGAWLGLPLAVVEILWAGLGSRGPAHAGWGRG
jgi:hypothetical protein